MEHIRAGGGGPPHRSLGGLFTTDHRCRDEMHQARWSKYPHSRIGGSGFGCSGTRQLCAHVSNTVSLQPRTDLKCKQGRARPKPRRLDQCAVRGGLTIRWVLGCPSRRLSALRAQRVDKAEPVHQRPQKGRKPEYIVGYLLTPLTMGRGICKHTIITQYLCNKAL